MFEFFFCFARRLAYAQVIRADLALKQRDANSRAFEAKMQWLVSQKSP